MSIPRMREPTPDGASPFVIRALAQVQLPPSALVLDLPCGFGRHALYLARLGHRVIGVDINAVRVVAARTAAAAAHRVVPVLVADAMAALPFRLGAFDAALIVDYVSPPLLEQIGKFLKPGGVLIYQSFPARGRNWQQLLPPGTTVQLLETYFRLTFVEARAVGPTKKEAETVRLWGYRH